jgi:hypothetical protein
MENMMIRVKVQYDAVHRVFKLVDKDFNTILEGDALYDLNIPVTMYEEAEAADFVASATSSLAHA